MKQIIKEYMDALELIKLIWPMLVIQLALQIFAVVDVFRKKKTRNLSVPVWVIIILLGEILGPIIYFLAGRSEE
jgi:DMSO reductase anchor subunit